MKIPFFSLFKKPVEIVSDEITSKFKTPFFTTYILVWIIKNNIFFYNLLFNSAIKDKSSILKIYFNLSERSFYLNILLTLFISLVVLFVFYIFLNISRSITILSEERVKLNLLNFIKSKKISSIDDINFLKIKTKELTEKNKKLNNENSKLRSSIGFLESDKETIRTKIKIAYQDSDKAINQIKRLISNYISDNKNLAQASSTSELEHKIHQEYQNYQKAKSGVPSFLSI